MNKKEEIINIKMLLSQLVKEIQKTQDECKLLGLFVSKINAGTICDVEITTKYFDYRKQWKDEFYIENLRKDIERLNNKTMKIDLLLDHLGLEVTTIPAQPEKKVS